MLRRLPAVGTPADPAYETVWMEMEDSEPASARPAWSTLVGRGLRLRCPACGKGKLFRTWLTMLDPCEVCGRKFDRAPGYLLGSIYFNYGVTTLLVVVIYFSLFFSKVLVGRPLLFLMVGFILLFPLWFFRYARGLWIAFDEQFDPWPNEQEAREMANQASRDRAE